MKQVQELKPKLLENKVVKNTLTFEKLEWTFLTV